MDRVFIDTDVVIDLFLNREPHHTEALRLFTKLKRSRIDICTSPVVLANTYYFLAKIRDKRYSLEKIRRLRKLLSILPIDQETIDSAIEAPFKDFEDGIQYYCAARNGAKTIVTRNTKDFPRAEVAIANPGEYLKQAEDKNEVNEPRT